jgi:putative oxidoreductase
VKKRLFDPGSDGRMRDFGLLLMRVGFAVVLIAAHGWGKFMRFGQAAEDFADPIGIGPGATMALAIFSEVLCAAAVALGFMTRLALVPLITTFVVAFFVQHAGDPFPSKEKALLFLIAFVALLAMGPGRFSVDRVLSRR